MNVNVNYALYDLDRLAANLAAVRKIIRVGVNVFASLKGNAYGYGAVPVARVLAREGVNTIMTGSYEEACAIKAAGIQLTTIMFAVTPPDGIVDIIRAGFVPTIVDNAGAQAAARALTEVSDIYVKLDMGFGRLGVPENDIENFLEKLRERPGVRVAGLYTHLPFATRGALDWANERFVAFDHLLDRLKRRGLLPGVTQAGASSSVATGLHDGGSAVCVGHLLFGLSPFTETDVGDLDAFQSVFRKLSSRLVQVVDRPAGSDQIRRIGIAPIGIAHGLKQPLPGNSTFVLVGGRRAPVLSVALEHTTLDLDGVPAAIPGDEVVLVGRQADERTTLDQFASWFGVSNLEMVSMICGRVSASYMGGES